MKIVCHISAILALSLFLISCSKDKDEGKVIPRSKLAEIYAEMLMTDQWITGTPGIRQIADTSLVYEPILEKYGYTSADYRKSVDKYMDDPERFSRILRTTGELLDKRLTSLKKRKEELDHIRALEKLLHQLKYEADFKAEDFFPYLFDEPYVHYYDSLDVKPDSVLMVYRFNNIDRADTLFDGVRIIVRDSLDVKDTLAQSDTLAPVDSIAAKDSLTAAGSIVRPVLPARKLVLNTGGKMKETTVD